METHHQQEPQEQQHQQGHEGLGDSSSTGSSSKSSFLCRQSSTRWTPTSDQIRILKDLYYNNGVRSPSAEQIQKISARLRQYGKIEGKNVFYWFQNHKARERQKKRFTVDMAAMQRGGGGSSTVNAWKSDDSIIHAKYTTNNIITPGVSSSSSCPSSPGVLGVGQMGSMGFGPVLMEKSFRDCSISSGGSSSLCWIGNASVDPYSTPDHFFYKTKPIQFIREEDEEQQLEEEEEEEVEAEAPEIETLPLFPMHGEDNCPRMQQPSWYAPEADKPGSRTSLELSLNSYSGRPSGTD